MVKMGMDIDETRNHRIRGIVPTEDGKYLFVEIMQGRRPDIKYTSCSKKEYTIPVIILRVSISSERNSFEKLRINSLFSIE